MQPSSVVAEANRGEEGYTSRGAGAACPEERVLLAPPLPPGTGLSTGLLGLSLSWLHQEDTTAVKHDSSPSPQDQIGLSRVVGWIFMAFVFFTRCSSVQMEKLIALSSLSLAALPGLPLFSHEVLNTWKVKLL